MSAAAARHLPHFSGVGLTGLQPRGPFRPLGETVAADAPADRSDTERAVEKALAEARVEFERLRAADRIEHERQLADRTSEIEEAIANRLAAGIASGLQQINDGVATHVARVLARFLEGAVRERALDELSEAVAALLAEGGATRVTIAGPAGLVERLKAAAEAAKTPVTTVTSGAADVTVTIDDTLLGTRIDAWMQRISAAVKGPDNV